ncbi:ABC transporter ATP-binding protein [Candidatus Kaiserbacteria bacterium]|nr:ABC transporter ATP-binding protein [Candidatus Kaiserbacteria bacterium]
MVSVSILQTQKLHKHFNGVNAVDHLSLRIEKGKVTGIVGPNGSGKTTLVNLLTGMVPSDSGAVLVSEMKLSRIRPYDVRTYGMTRTFQQVRLFQQMSVLDNVLVVLTERGVFLSLFEYHTNFHLRQAKVVLEQVGLWDKRNENAENLSYGQRKLLEIARALAMGSDTMLLDEPFAGLFPSMKKTVAGIVQKLRSEGKTVVLIEHDMEIIKHLSDHLIVLDAGKLLAEGKSHEVLSRKEVIEAYLGE